MIRLRNISRPHLFFVIIFLFVTSCSSRRISFSSSHENAYVVVGNEKHKMPCNLKVDLEEQSALIKTSDGEEKIVTLPEPPSLGKRTQSNILKVTGTTLEIIAYPLLAAGAISLFVILNDDDQLSASDYSTKNKSEENNDFDDIILTGLGLGLVGIVLEAGGSSLNKKAEIKPDEVYVEFNARHKQN